MATAIEQAQSVAESDEQRLGVKNGEAAAAILAVGIGSLTFGLIVPLSEAISALKTVLVLGIPAVGPLAGKTAAMVVVWLISWVALHRTWRGKQVDFDKVMLVTYILVIIGLIGSFPPFYEAFTAH